MKTWIVAAWSIHSEFNENLVHKSWLYHLSLLPDYSDHSRDSDGRWMTDTHSRRVLQLPIVAPSIEFS